MAYKKRQPSEIDSMSEEELKSRLAENEAIISSTLKQEGGLHTPNTLRLRKENYHIKSLLKLNPTI